MRTITQYAYALAGRRIGPWRSDRRDAKIDALREGYAQRDRYVEGRIYVTVPASIISREAEPPMDDALIEAVRDDFAPAQNRRPPLRLVA